MVVSALAFSFLFEEGKASWATGYRFILRV